MDCHALFQGIFPTQGSNPRLVHLLHWRQIPEPPGKPKVHPDSAATRNPLERKEKVKTLSHVQFFTTPWTVPARLLHPWDSPGKNSGVSCHSLLQGIFLTQGLNPGLCLHCRQILYHLAPKEAQIHHVQHTNKHIFNILHIAL